jgi:site-specific DNA recombinase
MPAGEVAWVCAAPMEIIAAGGPRAGGDVLGRWADGLGRRQRMGPRRGLVWFAFYGRVSTEDWQDPESSRARQL